MESEACSMGIYLNPGNSEFTETLNKQIYVDKSLLIEKVYRYAVDVNKYICFSRPRRFGKSTDAFMLTAYFSKGCDSHALFDALKVAQTKDYELHRNKYNVIHLNIQEFLSNATCIRDVIDRIDGSVLKEIRQAFPDYCEYNRLFETLKAIHAYQCETFIFVLDEWDCIFREYKEDDEAQRKYLDYLRLLLKDQAYVKLVYMTGILPIKKYGTHSALNMFTEISMVQPSVFSEFMGFTEDEVRNLCETYSVDFKIMQQWYDGYQLRNHISIYSPKSVTMAINEGDFQNYWSQTETYDALKDYIDLNYDGIKDAILRMLNDEKIMVDTSSFQNDMSSFRSKDDVFTLLIHLGYLGYDGVDRTIYIPNNEVKDSFITSIKNSDWGTIQKIFQNSNDLLQATWNYNEKKVMSYIETAHMETSILQYNDENALAYTVNLAYIAAKNYYTIVREFPTGRGFADLVFIPLADKPAMLIELKYDKTVETGMQQIKDKKYYFGLERYKDNLLLVAINYNLTTKKHECKIEKFS